MHHVSWVLENLKRKLQFNHIKMLRPSKGVDKFQCTTLQDGKSIERLTLICIHAADSVQGKSHFHFIECPFTLFVSLTVSLDVSK